MTLKELIEANGMTMYRFAKESGIPVNVVQYMAQHKVDICKCRAEYIYYAAKTLGMTMEELVELGFKQREEKQAAQEKEKEKEQETKKS